MITSFEKAFEYFANMRITETVNQIAKCEEYKILEAKINCFSESIQDELREDIKHFIDELINSYNEQTFLLNQYVYKQGLKDGMALKNMEKWR
jgi:hypothetical protein